MASILSACFYSAIKHAISQNHLFDKTCCFTKQAISQNMLFHKIDQSELRTVCMYGSYENHIYTGSSVNLDVLIGLAQICQQMP